MLTFEVNQHRPECVLDLLGQAGFIYEAKRRRLEPKLPEIMANWRACMNEKNPVMWTYVGRDASSADFSTVSLWLSSRRLVHCQHLASTPRKGLAREALRHASAHFLGCLPSPGTYGSIWFRSDNAYANAMFGGVSTSKYMLPFELTSFTLLEVPEVVPGPSRDDSFACNEIHDLAAASATQFYAFMGASASASYLDAYELTSSDFNYDGVDRMFAGAAGLSRRRRVFIYNDAASARPLAVLLLYSGPVGMSLSFLENRADVFFDAGLSFVRKRALARAMLEKLVERGDSKVGRTPLVVRHEDVTAFMAHQATFVREYTSLLIPFPVLAWYMNSGGAAASIN